MKLLLIYPECECSVTNTHTYSLPLGLGSIATYCKERMSDLEVKILDGSVMTHEEQRKIVEEFEPDVTGLSPTIGSMHNAYDIGELAKRQDSRVVLGGVHATALWPNILRNRDFVDGVVLYDGEKAIHSYLERIEKYDGLLEGKTGHDLFMAKVAMGWVSNPLDNFAFKYNSKPDIESLNLREILDINYSLFDLERHFEQTEKRGFGRAVSYSPGRGCPKRGHVELMKRYTYEEYQKLVDAMDTCTFCGRNELGVREGEEAREGRILTYLHDELGVRFYFNTQDKANVKSKEQVGHDDSIYRLFMGTEDVTLNNIANAKHKYSPNITYQVGIETATPEMREAYGKKPINAKEIFEKVQLMEDEGVQLHASFILGGKGETKDSVLMTTDLIAGLAQYNNVSWILVSPQLILPGSKDYKALLQMPEMMKKWGNEDLIDIPEINRDFLRWFAPETSRDYILGEIKDTFDDIKTISSNIVLDVKGVVGEEEKYVGPYRPYSES
ncbi:cobalamin-dependent protein [Candidatus Woesearchaeota archaeon]|nr:cobalamin-dependent protein [Candidatus Woesearchaeota archaeon]